MKVLPSIHEANRNDNPWLSVLVPTYCYPEGLERIMARLKSSSSRKIEIVIFDDSPDTDLEKIAFKYAKQSNLNIVYQRNLPALGPIGNWNALLDAARGDYCLLMHHDEFPMENNFIGDLENEVTCSNGADILLLDCLLVNPLNGRCRRHLPMWLRAFVINSYPGFLFRRNVIGPTSALVIRRALYPRFNMQLRWLVDVDLYFRALKSTKKIKICSLVKIGSILGRTDSITAKLGSEIKKIKRDECVYLNEQHSYPRVWLNMNRSKLSFGSIIYFFESIAWFGFRVIYNIANIFISNSISIEKLR